MTLFAMVRQLFHHGRYIWFNAVNDLWYRYAGSGLGIFWNVLHPLLEIIIYTLLFSWMLSKETVGVDYSVYLSAGLLTWKSFSETISRGGAAFFEHSQYVKQLAIPIEVFPAKVALTSTLLLFVYYGLLLVMNWVLGRPPCGEYFLLPVLLASLQCLGFAMSLSLAHLQVLFPDIKELVSAMIPLWRWTLPIIYPETVFPDSFRIWLHLNPPYVFIRSVRDLLIHRSLPGLTDSLIMTGWLLAFLWVGAFVNRRLQAEVRESL